MCFYHDDYPEIQNARVVKARKPHKCSICRAAIQPGEQYERVSGLYDGHFFNDCLCRRCCYDIYRIVERELAEGCRWDEAWPAFSEVLDHLDESGLGQTKPEDVPESFKVGDVPRMPERKPAHEPTGTVAFGGATS